MYSNLRKKTFLGESRKTLQRRNLWPVLRDSWTRDRDGKKDSVRSDRLMPLFLGHWAKQARQCGMVSIPGPQHGLGKSISFWRTWWRNLYIVLILADLVQILFVSEGSMTLRTSVHFKNSYCIPITETAVLDMAIFLLLMLIHWAEYIKTDIFT